MPVALAVIKSDPSRRRKRLRIEATFSGNYVTDGDAINWTSMTNPNKEVRASIGRQLLKSDISILNAPDGYTFEFVVGTLLSNWKLIIRSTADTQLAAAGYPAALSGVKLALEVITPAFV